MISPLYLFLQITGLTIIVLSVWMLTDPTFYISMAQDQSSYYSGVYLFLIVGSLMFIVGFLGCCGTIKESQCMLVLVSVIKPYLWNYLTNFVIVFKYGSKFCIIFFVQSLLRNNMLFWVSFLKRYYSNKHIPELV